MFGSQKAATSIRGLGEGVFACCAQPNQGPTCTQPFCAFS